MREFYVAGQRIADETPAYVIAEIGHNHGGSFDTARTLIQTAALCGAHAVKFQKREIDTLYSREMLDALYEHDHSYGRTYGQHRKRLEFGAKEYLACRTVAKAANVAFFATAFDEPSADFLMTIGVPAIKVASSGLTDKPLLRHVASLGVPLIVSTGGACWSEVDVAAALLAGTPHAFLHATAAYPVLNYCELNLRAIVEMRIRYPETVIGWSGHDSGIAMAMLAYAFGARIIEKHFTLNRAMKGTDHAFSLEPSGLRKLCRDLARAHLAVGDGVKRMYDSERAPLAKMRRIETPTGMKVTGALHAAFH